MSNVLLTSNSTEFEQRVRDASGGSCIVLPATALPTEPSQLLALTQHASLPDVVMLEATQDPERALALALRFDQELPGTGVMLVGDPTALALGAMRCGVRDVVPADMGVENLRAAIDRVADAAKARRASASFVDGVPLPVGAPGRVITVLSPKGGAGKTTVATNLAFGLSQAAPGSVVLVDLDVQFGDVATALNLEPEFSLDDVVHGAALTDPIALKTHLTLHDSGLSVISAPDSPVAADSVTSDQVSALLAMLAAQFRFVVVDTAAGLEPRTLAALDHTTDPVLLSTFDVAGARGLRREIATLRELGMLPAARHVLLNFADPRSGLTVSDVEATIRSQVDFTLPYSKAATNCFNVGVPLLSQKPNDPLSKQLRKLTAAFVGAGARRTFGRHRAAS